MHLKKIMAYALMLACLFSIGAQSSMAQNLAEFEKKVTEFTLDNGMKFIIVERHEAPVVSMFTHADVGSVDEVKGITGMAHVFEHMAFKGTKTVGTKDLKKELEAMEAVDVAFDKLRAERNKGALADTAKIKQLEKDFQEAAKAAKEWVVSNEVGEAIDRAGGVGLNASTSWDWTIYFYNLPSNKIELWFSLESDRFLNPVLREYYSEKDVVMEERRLRTESNPFGRVLEEFFTTAYKAHPYGEPVVGHMSDLKSMTRAEARAFFKKYYGANNLTVVIVGDVKPSEMKKLAKTYFGRLPSAPKPDPVETIEPPQIGERRVIVEDKSQPILVAGYKKGSIHDKDDPVFNVIADIIGRGRASRMYKRLVKQDKLAIQSGCFAGFPGEKYPNMILFFAIPSQGHTAEENENVIYEEIERLKNEPVTPEELAKAKTRARADLIRQLGSNAGLARQLAYYSVLSGDWRNLFRRLDRINAVTAEDIQRVAKEYFVPNHRTVALIKTVKDEPVAGTN
jgi:predicted Zn-dependent peptidase